jgi:RND superfamily putative drug exporter
MILVFLSFLLNPNIIIQQFGVGLAAAIIIDAFVVRTVLVPALMHVFGPANWWLPGWLDRRLPHLAVNVPDVVCDVVPDAPAPARAAGAQSASPQGPVPEILRGEMRVTKPAG